MGLWCPPSSASCDVITPDTIVPRILPSAEDEEAMPLLGHDSTDWPLKNHSSATRHIEEPTPSVTFVDEDEDTLNTSSTL
jgi:hypothetical protein